MSNYNVTLTLETIRSLTVMFLDIFIMWLVLYYALKIIRSNARTIQIFKGILLVVIIDALAKFFGLKTLSYLTNIFINWGFLAIIIIFQPEIRSLLERMGKSSVFSRITTLTGNEKEKLVDQIVTATMLLSNDQTGALISIEQSHPLDDFVATGTKLNSDVTAELLTSIFVTSTPLHDGAVIIQGDKIACASAYFPPTNLDLPSRYGARHRAAIGISEITDAVTIIVSEETGTISVTEGGKIFTVDRKQLRNYLLRVICGEETEVKVESHREADQARENADREESVQTKEKTERLEDTSVIKKIPLKKREKVEPDKIEVEEVVPPEVVIEDTTGSTQNTADIRIAQLEEEASEIKLPRKKSRPKPSYPKSAEKQQMKKEMIQSVNQKVKEEKVDVKPIEPKPIEPKQATPKPIEPKPIEPKVEAKQEEKPIVKPIVQEVKPIEPQPVEDKPIVIPEEEVVEVKPVVQPKPLPQAPRMTAEEVRAARERTKEILSGKTMEIKTTEVEEEKKEEEELPYDPSKLDVSKIIGMDDELDKTFEMLDTLHMKKSSKKDKGGDR